MWRVALTVLAVSWQTALATPATDAYARGETLYTAGEYLRAAAAFEEAYVYDPDPATLFNIAQAYRFGHACAKAVDYYKRFLAAGTAPNADQVQGFIAEQERCAKQQADAARVTPPQPPDQPPPRDPGSIDRGRTLRWIGVGTGVVGLAALGAGTYFGLRALDLTHKRNACGDPKPCTLAERDGYDADGARAERKQIISLVVGGVAAATGVTLVVLGRRARHEAPTVVIVPDRGGAFAAGTFRF